MRLASLARVARDYGARSLAARTLMQLINAISRNRSVDAGEPFLAPCERFDTVAPGEALDNWVFTALLEAFEQFSTFSTFFSGASSRPRLERIRDGGFGSAEMERQLGLLQRRIGASTRQAST